MKKKTIIGLVLSVVVLLVIGWSIAGRSYVPKIVGATDLSQDKTQAIISVEQGYYNSNLPLFATKIEILENTNDKILYRVSYFPFGSIERSYTKEQDGNWNFNLESSLFRID